MLACLLAGRPWLGAAIGLRIAFCYLGLVTSSLLAQVGHYLLGWFDGALPGRKEGWMKLGKDGVKRLVLLTSSSDLIPVWNG